MISIDAVRGLLDAQMPGQLPTIIQPDAAKPVPYRVLYVAAPLPFGRRLDGAMATGVATIRVVNVSNTPEGARKLADLTAKALDGAWIGGNRARLVLHSTAARDDQDPQSVRWVVTTEVHVADNN